MAFIYELIDDYYVVTGYVNDVPLDIPSEYEGKPVKGIGYKAFANCTSLTSITIPNSVTSIGKSAFNGCSSLKKVVINASEIEIQDQAFYNCGELASVEISSKSNSGNINIGMQVFQNSGLTSLEIPSSVKSIGYKAFENCISLKSIIFEENTSLTFNGARIFYGCTALSKVTMEEGFTYLAANMFEGCTSLSEVLLPSSLIEIRSYAFKDCTALKTIIIPEKVDKIGASAFNGCENLTSVNICNTIKVEFGYWSFGNCKSINQLLIRSNVITTAGSSNDYYTAIFAKDNTSSSSVAMTITEIAATAPFIQALKDLGAIKNLNKLIITCGTEKTVDDRLLSGYKSLTSVTIGNGITSIGSSAFHECSSLTSVTIPDSVTRISDNAFSGCGSLEKVNYLGTIDEWAQIEFSNSSANPTSCAENAENLYIDNELVAEVNLTTATKIGSYAFYNFTWLTSIVLPNSVKSIGSYAFCNCSSLINVVIGDSVTSIGYDAFYGCSSLESIEIPDSVTSIGSRVFYDCSLLTNVIIGNSVTSIGSSMFHNCSSLASITFPNNLKSLDKRAFMNCSSLTSITIPNSVTTIGNGAFEGCSSLESITLPFVGAALNGTENTAFSYIFGGEGNVPVSLKTVAITGGTRISYQAFYGCTSLTSIEIPDSVTGIGAAAFLNCTSLTNVTIGSGITTIGIDAFYNCFSLTRVDYTGTIDNWVQIDFKDHYANPLYYAKNLFIDKKSVAAAYITKNIKAYAFYNCKSLTTVAMNENVVTIGNSAFKGCYSLNTLMIGTAVTSIGGNAFEGCSLNNKRVIIPNSVKKIDSSVFKNCLADKIYCVKTTKPGEWSDTWNPTNIPVEWGFSLSDNLTIPEVKCSTEFEDEWYNFTTNEHTLPECHFEYKRYLILRYEIKSQDAYFLDLKYSLQGITQQQNIQIQNYCSTKTVANIDIYKYKLQLTSELFSVAQGTPEIIVETSATVSNIYTTASNNSSSAPVEYSYTHSYTTALPPSSKDLAVTLTRHSADNIECSWTKPDDIEANPSVAGYCIELFYKKKGDSEFKQVKNLTFSDEYKLVYEQTNKDPVKVKPDGVEISYIGIGSSQEAYINNPNQTSFYFKPRDFCIQKDDFFMIKVYPYIVYGCYLTADENDHYYMEHSAYLSSEGGESYDMEFKLGVVRVKTDQGWKEGQVWVCVAASTSPSGFKWKEADSIYTRAADGTWKESI